MCKADTLYFINYLDQFISETENLIWTQNHSCWLEITSKKDINKSIVRRELDALGRLKSMDINLKKIIESFDTAGFVPYVNTHDMPRGKSMSFTRIIRNNNKWKYQFSRSFMRNPYER